MDNVPEKKDYSKYIYALKNAPLDGVPFHSNTLCIDRYISENFPVHAAIHVISAVNTIPQEYVNLHKHTVPEINILLGNVEYKICFENEEYLIKSPSNIWIPKDTLHSANVISGSGYYICIILDSEYAATGKK